MTASRVSICLLALLPLALFGAGCSDAWDATQLNTLRAASDHRADVSPDAIVEALVYTAKNPAPIALPIVIELSKDEVEDVRFATVGALAAYPDTNARDALAALAASDKSEQVREEAKAAMERARGVKK